MLAYLPIIGTIIKAATGFVINERRIGLERYRIREQQAIARAEMEHERAMQALLSAERSDRWKVEFQATKEFQKELQQREHAWQWKIAEQHRKALLESEEYRKILENNPLRLFPSQIHDFIQRRSSTGRSPLLVLLSPPQVDFDATILPSGNLPAIEKQISEELRRLFSHYEPDVRPVQFMGGAWDTKRIHGETAATMLFLQTSSIPTLFIESELVGDAINIRTFFWVPGQEHFSYKPLVSQLSFRDQLRAIAREHARHWEADRARHLKLGRTEAEVAVLGGENERNLASILLEEADRAAGIRDWQRDYEFSGEHVSQFCETFTLWHCLLAGFIADAYYLTYHRVSPTLPGLLSLVLDGAEDTQSTAVVLQFLLDGYQELYASLEGRISHWMPQLYLEFAKALLPLRDHSWARVQIEKALRSLEALDGVGLREKNGMEALADYLDHEQLEDLRHILETVGNHAAARRVAAWAEEVRRLPERVSGIDEQGVRLDEIWG